MDEYVVTDSERNLGTLDDICRQSDGRWEVTAFIIGTRYDGLQLLRRNECQKS